MTPTDGARGDGRAQRFAAERPRLVGLAYRMLGSVADAEDVVQDAWLRYAALERPEELRSPPAWLTTVTSRLAIDRLRRLRRERDRYVGPWLPEPVPTHHAPDPPATDLPAVDPPAADAPDPAERVVRDESLSYGLLVVLESLSEVERAVFVLADVFATPHAEIASVVGRSPEACRQIASRARRRVREQRDRSAEIDEGLLGELVSAVTLADTARVLELLAPEVVLLSDGGSARRAARRPVLGPERVARFMVNLAGRVPDGAQVAVEQLNGAPALVVRDPVADLALLVERDSATGAVRSLRLVMNREKLAALDRAPEIR